MVEVYSFLVNKKLIAKMVSWICMYKMYMYMHHIVMSLLVYVIMTILVIELNT